MTKAARTLAAAWGFLLLVFAVSVQAGNNAIQKIQTRMDGSALIMQIDMEADMQAAPGTWSVLEPPRIVFDFPATSNKTGAAVTAVSLGELKSYNVVQTDQLTRLVLNLYRTAQYSMETRGNSLLVRLEARNLEKETSGTAPSVMKAVDFERKGVDVRSTDASVRDIKFERGEEGQALLKVQLTDGTVPVDVRRDGNQLAINLPGTNLPSTLALKSDVNDFATPVNYYTAKRIGNGTRIDITSRGKWFHQTRLANGELSIEIKAITADEVNRLVQSGQQGQKVSINFFEAEATMVLRTLAEISGRNVMIDPSLAGRRITVSLDNIAYDQALDIVLAQVSAAMRVNDAVVLFGDRAVLQKRDQDKADDLTRANEIAPLVSEVFTLSYIKPTEMVNLIRANIAAPGGTSNAPAGGQAAAPAAGAAAPAAGAATTGGGMLSARGSVSPHDLTKKLFVRDTAMVVESIREMIRNVDVPQQQVMIEVRIVRSSTDGARNLGARLRMFNRGTTELGSGANIVAGVPSNTAATFSNIDAFGTVTTPTLAYNGNPTFDTRVGPAQGTGNIGLMIFNNAATRLLTLELAASETDKLSKSVSAPRVVTESGKAATISSTTTLTYQSGVNNGAATYAQCVGPLNLTVTPIVTPGNLIQMALNVQRGNATVIGQAPSQTCQSSVDSIQTNLAVENGGTVVIGGVQTEDEAKGEERLPFLGDIPYLGFLFKSTTKQESRNELLIFITPKVVSDNSRRL